MNVTEDSLDIFHPAFSLVEWLIEPAEPMNFGRYFLYSRGVYEDDRALNVLMTEGLLDIYTPYETSEALAVAIGLPIIEPVASSVEGLELLGLDPVGGPKQNRRSSYVDLMKYNLNVLQEAMQ